MKKKGETFAAHEKFTDTKIGEGGGGGKLRITFSLK